ncbi:MAG: energy transducer TonB [Terracidiphilus sp.]
MRSVEFVLVLLTFLLPASRAQQQSSPAKPTQPEPAIVYAESATPQDLAVPLCPAKFDDGLSIDGIAAAGVAGVKPPKAKKMASAKFPGEAHRAGNKKHIHYFEVDLSFVVGVDGRPHDVCLTKSSGYGLDASAAKALSKSRFTPALKDGKPVPVRLNSKVAYKLY